MEPISLTSLRKNLFKIMDGVIKTGIPIEIERNGQKLKIVIEEKKSKLDNLRTHDCIVGSPDDLVNLKVAQWDEARNL